MKQLFGVLFLVGAVCVFWKWVLAAVVVFLVFRAVQAGLKDAGEKAAADVVRCRGLVARADQQHAWVIAGDERGVYGAFPPA